MFSLWLCTMDGRPEMTLSEKQRIERASAQAFLDLFNAEFGEDYEIVEHDDAPDFRCLNSAGARLNIETTITEDRHGDAAVLLGRPPPPSIDELTDSLRDELAAGGDLVKQLCSEEASIDNLVERIRHKMRNDYGPNAALVVRDISPLDWEWDQLAAAVRQRLDLSTNPFDGGIWVLYRWKQAIVRIDA